jgi:hypothetical protein
MLISGILFPALLFAQYPPPAGQPGTTAIFQDSSVFIGWSSTCIIERGFINIADSTLTFNGSNRSTAGSPVSALGPPDGMVVSLGDHGSALLSFEIPIVNRAGPDFAVFENSFNDSFLELGFVEVSSDGHHFVRFPAVSLIQSTQQVYTFDTIDATKIHNFAGKYKHAFGTPFDLDDIKDSVGIDLNNIINIRIIDAIGCIQAHYATTDSQGHTVNDPWPTPFDTGGFDLDAVGVIHNKSNGYPWASPGAFIQIYPNPVLNQIAIKCNGCGKVQCSFADQVGNVLLRVDVNGKEMLDMSLYPPGFYLARFIFENGNSITKKIIKY